MITSIDQVSEYPLCWPDSKPRAAKREEHPYNHDGHKLRWNATMAAGRQQVEDEMRRIGVGPHDYVISMSPRHRLGSPDPGVSVWWLDPWATGKAELRVIACDAYTKPEVNLYAIGLTLCRLRLIEVYGAYSLEQALEGARLALPPPAGSEPVDWKAILGYVSALPNDKQLVLVEHTYRSLSKEAFAKGDEMMQTRLNLAIEAARADLQ